MNACVNLSPVPQQKYPFDISQLLQAINAPENFKFKSYLACSSVSKRADMSTFQRG